MLLYIGTILKFVYKPAILHLLTLGFDEHAVVGRSLFMRKMMQCFHFCLVSIINFPHSNSSSSELKLRSCSKMLQGRCGMQQLNSGRSIVFFEKFVAAPSISILQWHPWMQSCIMNTVSTCQRGLQ